jgi:uncharacterized membrane-anchored protein YhcB (DUF1043 family)
MNGQRAVGVIAGAVFAAMLLTTAAVAAAEPLAPEAIRALGERYQAMAEHYGTSSSLPREAIQAMGERYQVMAEHYGGSSDTGTATDLPPQALEALGSRWVAAAQYYRQAELEQARQAAGAFDWLDAAIGALAATGAVALLGLGALGLGVGAHRSAGPAVS